MSIFKVIPDGVQKCGHGSSLDLGGIGGINKDTSSACFSPHNSYHRQAARLAETVRLLFMVDREMSRASSFFT